MSTIEEYRASQDAMEKLRARHVGDAFKEAAGEGYSPAQLSTLVGSLDLAQFVGEDGEVDRKRVTDLLAALAGGGTVKGGSAKGGSAKGGSVKEQMAQRLAERDAKSQ